jgi:hypothetical protein
LGGKQRGEAVAEAGSTRQPKEIPKRATTYQRGKMATRREKPYLEVVRWRAKR